MPVGIQVLPYCLQNVILNQNSMQVNCNYCIFYRLHTAKNTQIFLHGQSFFPLMFYPVLASVSTKMIFLQHQYCCDANSTDTHRHLLPMSVWLSEQFWCVQTRFVLEKTKSEHILPKCSIYTYGRDKGLNHYMSCILMISCNIFFPLESFEPCLVNMFSLWD